jgi:hypothetical protein
MTRPIQQNDGKHPDSQKYTGRSGERRAREPGGYDGNYSLPNGGVTLLFCDLGVDASPKALCRDESVHFAVQNGKDQRTFLFGLSEQHRAITAIGDVVGDPNGLFRTRFTVQKGLYSTYVQTFSVHNVSLPTLP